jgi:hypothetical protein
VLSPKTVRDYVSNIFTRLHVVGRARAIVRVGEAGLGRRGGAASMMVLLRGSTDHGWAN